MRKDVKIGLAIAGVLFAVLIVYAFVPKKDVTQTAGTGDGQQVEGDNSADNPIPPADAAANLADAGKGHDAAKGDTADNDVFAENYKGGNETQGAGANANGNNGGTDWLSTLDKGTIVAVESHPSLIAQTKTPTAAGSGNTAAPTNGGTPAEVEHGPGGTPIVPSAGGDSPAEPGVTPPTSGGHVRRGGGNAGGPTSPANGGDRVRPTGSEQIAIDPAPPRPRSGGGQPHVVQKDETFITIARAVYGKQKYFAEIQKANPNVNPNRLKPGMTIILPDISGIEASSSTGRSAAGATTEATAKGGARVEKPAKGDRAFDPEKEYRVQQGDSLYKISVKLYGNGSHADELYDNNSAVIGPDKSRLKVGTYLKLHDAPRVKQAAR